MAKEKEILKEQERQERVNETVSKTDQFFRENKKTIYTIFLTLLVLGLAFVAWYKFIYQPKCQEATAQMFPAEANFRNGEYDLALNGDGNVLGFKDIIDQYGNKAGKAVNFYAGVSELQLGNFQEAIDFLKKYKGKDHILSARALACLGDAYTGLEDYNTAIGYFEKAADLSDNVYSAAYLLKAGVAYEELGNNDKALACYNRIKNDYPQSIEGYDIDKYIARIESK